MNSAAFTLTIHMVSSLDGMVAKNDNSVSWFETTDHFEKGSDAPDAEAFLNTIDCYVMGSKTYEHALVLSKTYGWAYGDKPMIVVSSRTLPVERPNIEFYSGELPDLVSGRLKPHYRNVWLVGGPMLAREFIRSGLANEIRLSILPILLGNGVLLFDQLGLELPLHVKNVTAYKNGLVELHYEIRPR